MEQLFEDPSLVGNTGYELSPEQQHVWTLRSQGAANAVQCRILLRGPVRPELIADALAMLVKRHEILRTVFVQPHAGSDPLQVVLPELAPDIETVSLRGLSSGHRHEAVSELAAGEFRNDDARRVPGLRALVIEIAHDEYECVLTVDSMYADQRTLDYLMAEFAGCYECCARGGARTGDIIQYADFAAWHNDILNSDAAEVGKGFWRESGLAAATHPQLSYEKGTVRGNHLSPRIATVNLDQRLVSEIEEVSRTLDSRPADFVMLCWQTVLFRNTLQSPVVVFESSDQRSEGATIGLFSRWLPIDTQLSQSSRFSTSLRELTGRIDRAAEWRDYYAEVDCERGGIAFEFIDEFSSIDAAGVRVAIRDRFAPAPQFKLCMTCFRHEDAWQLALQFDTNVFTTEQAESLLAQTIEVLRTATVACDYLIQDLALIDSQAGHKLIAHLNQTQTAYPRTASLQVLFETQAGQQTERVAVRFGEQTLTYEDLSERGNRIALRLAALGAKPGDAVGLCLERGIEMPIGVIGIIKAGCAYVPIDCECPRERAHLMARDAGLRLVLTDARGAELFSNVEGVKSVDISLTLLETPNLGNPACATDGDSIAYVMYTSGSTGVPKGISIPHRGVSRLVVDTNYVSIKPGDSIAQVANCAFDAVTFEIWGALLNGAELVIIPREIVLSPQEFADALSRRPIRAMFLTSALFNQVAQTIPHAFHTVDTLLVGGDALNPLWIRKVLSCEGRPRRILNGYGPTESTTFACVFEVKEVAQDAVAIPIGKPIANTEAFVLDHCLRPLPPGVPGDLFIAGDGLATGYLNDPKRTAFSFLANPYAIPGSRMYRTGDIARLRFDGNFDFLGRNDDQVKVRGFRIELAEIEAALIAHPRVESAAAIVRSDPSGNKRLIAYYVETAGAEAALTVADLRAFLLTRLPEYMLPAVFLRLDTLPLNLNGKLDRTRLPEPAEVETEFTRAPIAPRNSVEQQLSDIWRKVLNLKEVGVKDNFFELGGDSILSIRVVTEARKLGIALTPKRFLQCQTIAELAAVASSEAGSDYPDSEPLAGSSALSSSQAWHFDQPGPDFHHYNMAIQLQARRPIDVHVLEAAVNALFDYHDALRLRFRMGAEGWQQSTGDRSTATLLTTIDLSRLADSEARQKALDDATSEIQASLDHSDGPLTRFVYFELGKDSPGRLLIVTHHLVADAVSLRILVEDLLTAYEQISGGGPIALPAKTASYSRWADYVNRRVRQGALDHELQYWIEELSQANAPVRVDRSIDPVQVDTEQWSRSFVERLTSEDTRFLLQHAPTIYKSQFLELLLAAFARSFARWNRDRSVFIDLSIHGRQDFDEEAPDISRSVGWFSGLTPLRLNSCGMDDPGCDLSIVKRQLARMPNGGIGYQMIRYLGMESEQTRALRALQGPKVCFAYLGQFDEKILDQPIFELVRANNGPARSARNARRYTLEVFVGVVNQQLEIECNFSSLRYDDASIRALLEEMAGALRALKQDSRTA